MKNEFYKFLALVIVFFTCVFCFRYWMNTFIMQARNCAHIDIITAYKIPMATWNGKNEYGVDKSCYVEFELNGVKKKSEWWNVGDCHDTTPIEINVVDYTCY